MAGLARRERMGFEEFFEFTDTRPDEERWELIDGVPILNAAPIRAHQMVVGNLIRCLGAIQDARSAPWIAIPGIGAHVSDTSVPIPDAMILPFDESGDSDSERMTSDMLVAFEVLSPSTRRRDLNWKRKACASMAAVAHYVIIAPDKALVPVYSRSEGWAEQKIEGLGGSLRLDCLDIEVPLASVYQYMRVSRASAN